ncbi:inositol hexakisphosphate kinase 3 [Pelomyxa schiedti]|nr:inositol hexakisphosphate kinase 3 [Pelomyxa schiedti]
MHFEALCTEPMEANIALPVRAFQYQVAGHTEILSSPGMIFKPLNTRERGIYEHIQLHSQMIPAVPKCYGTLVVDKSLLPENPGSSVSLIWSRKHKPSSGASVDATSDSDSLSHSNVPPSSIEKSSPSITTSTSTQIPTTTTSPSICGSQSLPDAEASAHPSPSSPSPDELQSHHAPRNIEVPQSFLVIQDLTSAYKHPSILDIKLGTRQHGDECSLEKRERQIAKCANSTSSTLAFRICGMLVFLPASSTYRFQDKYVGRVLPMEQLKDRLGEFFENGTTRRLDLLPLFIEKFKTLAKRLEDSPYYRMYSVSMLAIYDSDSDSPKGDARIIDFAKTYILKPGEVCDDDVLRGLRNLIATLDMLMKDWAHTGSC